VKKRWLAAAVGIALACTAAAAMTVEERALSKGRLAVSALSDALREKLAASIKDSGPAGAMRVCSSEAQALTREVAERQGVRVGRTSLKLRNPENAPDAWERRVLSRLQEQAREGTLPDEVFEATEMGGKKVFRYARPVKIAPACVRCHGDRSQIPEEILGMLKERYPADQATGYKPGDLRGIVSAVIPAE
jgi:Protein of unknown function (DUF3365)